VITCYGGLRTKTNCEDGEERKQEAVYAACKECEAQYYYGNVHHHN
jgi:hypothetical protein